MMGDEMHGLEFGNENQGRYNYLYGEPVRYTGKDVSLQELHFVFNSWVLHHDRALIMCPSDAHKDMEVHWDEIEPDTTRAIPREVRGPRGEQTMGPAHPPSATGYVDGNPKTAAGAAKPPMGAVPGSALLALGLAMEVGKKKYGLTNWREFPVTTSTYYNAALRHILEFNDGHTFDKETGVHNLAHAMACFAIIIDAQAHGSITDDRTRFPGAVSALIAAISKGEKNALSEPR